MLYASEIKELASQMGFHDCGVAHAAQCRGFAAALHQWTAGGYHAGMHYMEQHADMRCDPRILQPGCRTVVSVVLAYKPTHVMTGTHRLAQYAYGRDYHEEVKERLWKLLAALQLRHIGLQGRAVVDTAPISDKYWAVQSGLGWQGRNTLFLHPRYGSFVFLGELLLSNEADCYDSPLPQKEITAENITSGNTPVEAIPAIEAFAQETIQQKALATETNRPHPCTGCHRCVEACPNQALAPTGPRGQYRLDARRCNAYNTIENRNPQLPAGLQLAGYTFGCDCCQLACPLNEQAPTMLAVPPQRITQLEQLWAAGEDAFREAAHSSALSRISFSQWQRNVQYEQQ